MEQLTTSGPTVFFAPQDRRDGRLVAAACDRAVTVLADTWGLRPPSDCRVYVVRDGRAFVTESAPPAWRAVLTVTKPVWSRTLAKSWRFSGGLSQRYGRRWVIGVKPAELMRAADPGVQHRLFVPDDSAEQRVRHVTYHELAHAAAAARKLPDWLDEGLAMLAVDRCLEMATVQPRTVDLLEHLPRRSERKHPVDAVLRYHAQAYWTTRYLDEAHHELLRRALAETAPGQVDGELARSLGCERPALMHTLEHAAHERFG